MAFVQLASAEDQHRCLSLHHSFLRGRRINVEKSCGGRDKSKRADRLREQREEQRAKIESKIAGIAAEFEARGALGPGGLEGLVALVRDRLFSYSPAHVQAVLANLERATGGAGPGPGHGHGHGPEQGHGSGYGAGAGYGDGYVDGYGGEGGSAAAVLDRCMDAFDRKLQRQSGAGPGAKRRRVEAVPEGEGEGEGGKGEGEGGDEENE